MYQVQTSFREIGTLVQRHGATARIIGCNDDFAVLDYVGYGQAPESVPITQLEAELGSTLHLMQPETPVTSLPKQMSLPERLEIERREHYVRQLHRKTGPKGVGGRKVRQEAIDKVSVRLHDKQPPSPATLGRWAKKDRDHSLGVACDILQPFRKQHASRFDALKPLVLEVFDEEFLKQNLPSFQFTYDVFIGRIEKKFGKDCDRPCYVTFINWIKDICPIKASKLRHGQKATREMMRNAIAQIRTTHPLQRVECDAIRLAIGLVDEENRYLGSVTVFFVLDCYTRCVLGYCLHIGNGEPTSCVIHAFRHALCPKPAGTFNPNCENDWPMYGVFESAVTDGGTGYTSMQTVSFLNTAGIPMSVTQTASGWKKPFVERFNGTVRTNLAQQIHSYCGHDLSVIQDKTLKQKASMTPDQFRMLLERWIVDEYHQSPHSGINNTPHQLWLDSFADTTCGPMLPANYDVLQLPQGQTVYATISGKDAHQGVVINNVRYNDAECRIKIIGLKLSQKGEPTIVECQYSINDISTITVRDPFTDITFEVAATPSIVIPGMTLAEFQAQWTKRYSKKGFGHKRIIATSDERKAGNDAHHDNPKVTRSTRSRPANPQQMANGVAQQKAENENARREQAANSENKSGTTGLSNLSLQDLEGHTTK